MVAPDAIGTRGIKVAMVTAVVAIFALAYLDLRREQSRALADFTAEQAALSRSLAATVGARMDAVFADLDTLITLDDAGRERLARQLIDGPLDLPRDRSVRRQRGEVQRPLHARGRAHRRLGHAGHGAHRAVGAEPARWPGPRLGAAAPLGKCA